MAFGGGFPTSGSPPGPQGPQGPPGIGNVTATLATPAAITAAGMVLYRKTNNQVELADGSAANLALVQGVSAGSAVGSSVTFVLPPSWVAVPGLTPGVRYVAKQDGTLVPEGTTITGPYTRQIGVGENDSLGTAGLRLELGPGGASRRLNLRRNFSALCLLLSLLIGLPTTAGAVSFTPLCQLGDRQLHPEAMHRHHAPGADPHSSGRKPAHGNPGHIDWHRHGQQHDLCLPRWRRAPSRRSSTASRPR